MFIDLSILDINNQSHVPPPNYENGGGTYIMDKRSIDVGPTVSAIVALVYLGVWIAGVSLCCCCLGRSRRVRTLFVWKGDRLGVDNLKDRPTSEASNGPPGIHGEIPKKFSIPVEHDPWVGTVSRLHQKPPKSKGKGKGKNKFSDSNQGHHIVPPPTDPQISLSSINEESMSNRMSTGGSKAIPHDHSGSKPMGPTIAPRAAAHRDFFDLSTMNSSPYTNSHSQNQTPAFPPFSRNSTYDAYDAYDAYGIPVHQLANAATSRRSLRLDSPMTADSDISRQLQTPSLDAFPLPPRLSTRSPQRENSLLATSPLPHGTNAPTAGSMLEPGDQR